MSFTKILPLLSLQEKIKSNPDEATHYSQIILGDDGEDGSSEDESGSFQPATNLPNSRVIKRNLEDLMRELFRYLHLGSKCKN
jgi:hypothetical protein